jgi:hypothetical protein
MAKRMRLAQFALAAVGLCMMTLAGTIALAKNQHHSNGHSLLGAKLNQNGKHEIGKIGNNAVAAEVSNKKVVNMSAGNLPARKVKSNKKMAGVELGDLKIAANGTIELAQVIDVSYGYCFDAGLESTVIGIRRPTSL